MEELGTEGCEEGRGVGKGEDGCWRGGVNVAGRRENTNTPKISGKVTGRNLFS